MRKNVTFAALAASALAALSIGLAAPVAAMPSGNGQDNVTTPTLPDHRSNRVRHLPEPPQVAVADNSLLSRIGTPPLAG